MRFLSFFIMMLCLAPNLTFGQDAAPPAEAVPAAPAPEAVSLPQPAPVAVAPQAAPVAPRTATIIPHIPSTPLSSATPRAASTVGWVEPVTLHPNAIPFIAKMDSGALTTSLRATIEQSFKREDGKEWVRFTLPDEKAPQTLFEVPLVRWASIRETDGSLQKRAVVQLTFCIANQLVTDEVNLAPRPNFIYPVLIGRNMLAGRFLIDSARDETTSPHCMGAPILPAAQVPTTPAPMAPAPVAQPPVVTPSITAPPAPVPPEPQQPAIIPTYPTPYPGYPAPTPNRTPRPPAPPLGTPYPG